MNEHHYWKWINPISYSILINISNRLLLNLFLLFWFNLIQLIFYCCIINMGN